MKHLKSILVVLFLLLFLVIYSFLNQQETSSELFLVNGSTVEINTTVVSSYPLHENIITTVFWVGEPESLDNDFISNAQSAWDDRWEPHFGGFDDPDNRDNYWPSSFKPKENPFYFALPYNDLKDGERRTNAEDVIYWADEKEFTNEDSMVKNRWIEITKEDKTVYAQWEDTGPFEYNDYDYVFGDSKPKNKVLSKSGLDVSPAIADYLNIDGLGVVSWRFIDFEQVPDGPWKEIITTSQIYWE